MSADAALSQPRRLIHGSGRKHHCPEAAGARNGSGCCLSDAVMPARARIQHMRAQGTSLGACREQARSGAAPGTDECWLLDSSTRRALPRGTRRAIPRGTRQALPRGVSACLICLSRTAATTARAADDVLRTVEKSSPAPAPPLAAPRGPDRQPRPACSPRAGASARAHVRQ